MKPWVHVLSKLFKLQNLMNTLKNKLEIFYKHHNVKGYNVESFLSEVTTYFYDCL